MMVFADTNRCGKGIPFSMGSNTLSVSRELHLLNRQRLAEKLKKNNNVDSSLILLQGGNSFHRYCTDVEPVFRQESFFHWTFGVEEPDYFGAIRVSDLYTILFMPRLPESYVVWLGEIPTPEKVAEKYGVHKVYYNDQKGQNTDSGVECQGASFDGITKFNVLDSVLYNAIAECRVQKTNLELDVLRYVNRISSNAHRAVMREISPGMKEYELEALFQYHCYRYGGCRNVAYCCICASGTNCAVLHYGGANAPNRRTIQDTDMCVFDMGAEYYCYASDITCSFPVNGRFSPEQKIVYEAVLSANRAVLHSLKPGVSWVDMHLLANETLLCKLHEAGILHGDIKEMMSVNLASVFQPHGLGHLMGCDVHDVGGYLEGFPQRPELCGLRNLRTSRILVPGMVLTIEPGCYFIDKLLDDALQDPLHQKFIVADKLQIFRKVGGVRIEDDVVITENGVELLTDVPRTVEEIEKWMASDNK